MVDMWKVCILGDPVYLFGENLKLSLWQLKNVKDVNVDDGDDDFNDADVDNDITLRVVDDDKDDGKWW